VSNSQTCDNPPHGLRGRIVDALGATRASSAASWLFSRFALWLDGDPLAFSQRPLAPPELARVRSEQLISTQRGAVAPIVGSMLCAVIVPISMWDTPARAALIAWALTLAANLAISRAAIVKSAARPCDDALELRRATLRTILNATIWAFGLVLAQNAANPDQRALIATIAMSVMSGGALQLAFAPPLAFGFIAPLALGCMFAAWRAPQSAALWILLAQLVNAGFLVFQAHFQATQLASRTVAHFADEVAARLDPLTGLGNRLGLSEHLAAAFARLAEGGAPFALICLDLDGFQLVNDSFGHLAGDEMILRAAQALRAVSGSSDYVARLGDDEFALIAAKAPSREAAAALAERIAAEFRQPFAFAWGESACSATIGAALAPEHGADGDHLARAADAALYRANQNGRGSIVFAGDADDPDARARLDTEAALRQALRNGEMRLEYQPLVDAAAGATRGFEALLRWRRPGYAEAPAAFFLSAAEACGCLEEIGVWALREATRVAATWPKRLRVAVNVSAGQFRSPSLVAAVRDIVESEGFDPRRLELEISDTSLIQDFEAAAASLNALRRYGVTIALDDFGAGFSSMRAVTSLPLDRIKVDRAFVAGALDNPRCAAVIRSAARLAKELGLGLTGKGVETIEQLDLLRSAGCDEAQGYLFSRPVPADALAPLFKRCPTVLPTRPTHDRARCENCSIPWCVESGMCKRRTLAV
jgi:diguanylate cyclase (GGDEF)-like protein